MDKYYYRAVKADGSPLSGYVEADTASDAVDYLHQQSCTPLEVKQAGSVHWRWLRYQVTACNKLKLRTLVMICKQLSIMLGAGISLCEALNSLSEDCDKNKSAQIFIKRTLEGLNEGKSLAAIWSQYDIVPQHILSILNVAEQTGLLAEAFKLCADYLSQRQRLCQRVQQAIAYPLVLVISMLLVITLMLFTIIPTFKEIFAQLNVPLPGLTKCLFSISDALIQHGEIWGPGLATGLVIIISWGYKYRTLIQNHLYNLAMHIPGLHRLLTALWLADFTKQWELLLASGLTLDNCLAVIQTNITYQYRQVQVQTLRLALQQGCNLYTACTYAHIDNHLCLQLLKAGEESGTITEMLTYINKVLTEEINAKLALLGTYLEPLLIIIVGILIGSFVYAMIIPLFDLPTAINS